MGNGRRNAALDKLTRFTRETGYVIGGCGCCGSPWMQRVKNLDGFYVADGDASGMDDIERIVGYFRHAAQGLEERKQILYLLGPVGGGKSSLAERLKELMEAYPIYVLAYEPRNAPLEISPVFEWQWLD